MFLKNISDRTLRKIMLYGGVAALGGAVVCTLGIQANFRRQPYYQLSVDLLNNYPPAVKLLGQPIRGKVDLSGAQFRTRTDELTAKLKIPVKGPRRKGTLYSWSSRPTIQDGWAVDKLDIEIENRRWTFYVNPNAPSAVSTELKVDAVDSCTDNTNSSASVPAVDCNVSRARPNLKNQELLYVDSATGS